MLGAHNTAPCANPSAATEISHRRGRRDRGRKRFHRGIVTSEEKAILVVVWVFLLLPVLPLSMLWARAYRQASLLRGLVLVIAVTVTLSFLVFVVSSEAEFLIGRHYTTRRYITIWVNLGLMIAGAVLSVLARTPLKWRLFAACVVVALDWLYAWAVSSVV